jgi:4-hydroxybenzoate polyprenyltransferase
VSVISLAVLFGLSTQQKIEFFTYGYRSLFTSFDNLLSVSVISLAVLFGVNIAVLTYSLRRKTASARATGTSGIAATLGILSSGCAACGTSLLGPLLATLGATSITAVHNIGTAFNLIGSALLLYSIYKLALQTPTNN